MGGTGLKESCEALINAVFANRCPVRLPPASSKRGNREFAVHDWNNPPTVIAVKGYGPTGPKMTDIIGDLDAIIEAKRHETRLLLVTDGTTWKSRISDLRKIARQNQGKIARVNTGKVRALRVANRQALRSNLGL